MVSFQDTIYNVLSSAGTEFRLREKLRCLIDYPVQSKIFGNDIR